MVKLDGDTPFNNIRGTTMGITIRTWMATQLNAAYLAAGGASDISARKAVLATDALIKELNGDTNG